MRKLVTILLILVSLNSYTQILDSIPNTTETERIIDKYSDNIINGFNTVIEKVTPLAEDGFKVVVKLQFIKGVVYLLPLVFAIIFLILFKKEYNTIYERIKDNNYNDNVFDGDNVSAFIVIYLILFSLFTITSLFSTYDALTHIFVPEWFAIKEIINLF